MLGLPPGLPAGERPMAGGPMKCGKRLKSVLISMLICPSPAWRLALAQRRGAANRRQLTLSVFVGEMSTDLSIV